jgi:sigma-B regulation protein RsbU (phosphoserine phosphatase)
MDTSNHFAAQNNMSLEQQVVRLQALLEATRLIHSTAPASEVLTQAAHILVRELELDGAMFLDPRSGQIMVAYGEVPEAPWEKCLRFPLYSKNQEVLAELIIAPTAGANFSVYDQDFVEGLALQTALALENATLHERDLAWARVQQDLDTARAVQRSLLPIATPDIPGFSIAWRSTTCYEVGGDYLDTFSLPDGSHLMVVADVAGKGLTSAIVASGFRAAIRSLASQQVTLEQIAARIGQQHWEEGVEARRRYMTALLLRLPVKASSIEIVNAGHNPAALVLPEGTVRMIGASGVPLGILPGMSYTAQTLEFPAGARILLYTDGLTEVFQDEEEFGEERLVATFRREVSLQPDDILDSIWQTLASYSNNAPQTDDMTALVMCRHTPNSENW